MSVLDPDAFAGYAAAIRWFLQHRGGRQPRPEAPIWRWIGSLERCAEGRETLDVDGHEDLTAGGVKSARTLTALCDLYAATAAAHAIQIIEARAADGSIALEVDGSFVSSEIGARDHGDPSAAALPASIGTLLVAAEAAWVGGGTLRVFGRKSNGLDVRWTDQDARVHIEAKARALASAFAKGTTADDVRRWAVDQVSVAAPLLRKRSREDGTPNALAVVRLTGFLPARLARATHERSEWLAVLKPCLKQLGSADAPHAIVVHWFGIDVERADGGGLVSVADSRPHYVWSKSTYPPPTEASRVLLATLVGNQSFGTS